MKIIITFILFMYSTCLFSQVNEYHFDYDLTYVSSGFLGKKDTVGVMTNAEADALFLDFSKTDLSDPSFNPSSMFIDFNKKILGMDLLMSGAPVYMEFSTDGIINIIGENLPVFFEEGHEKTIKSLPETSEGTYFNGDTKIFQLVPADLEDEALTVEIDENYDFNLTQILDFVFNKLMQQDVSFENIPNGLIVSVDRNFKLIEFNEIDSTFHFGREMNLTE